MRDRILRAMAHMPAGGIALHGTSYKKALQIAQRGLFDGSYLCTIPNPNFKAFKCRWESEQLFNGSYLPACDEREFFSRSVGAALFTLSYSLSDRHKKSGFHPNGERNPLPAVVIFADYSAERADFNLLGNDLETSFYRLLPSFQSRLYYSFGKRNWFRSSKPEVSAIAHLSKDDMEQIREQAKARAASSHTRTFKALSSRMKKDALVLKTLQLIERLALEGKPSEILVL